MVFSDLTRVNVLEPTRINLIGGLSWRNAYNNIKKGEFMIIHVVKSGDTIESIANTYGVSPERMISDNELENMEQLVVGETIVILIPSLVHTVVAGDSLLSIATQYGVSVIQLLRNNTFLSVGVNIYPGEEIVIEYKEEKIGRISVSGYAYPFINREALMKTLPFLTYLAIFTYGFTPEGELVTIDDEDLIRIARDFGVAPLMMLSTLTDAGTFSNELAHVVLNDLEVQNKLIDNVLINLNTKNYHGLDVDFEYILPEDRQGYVDFIKNITTKLNEKGYEVLVALAPKISADQPGLLYESHDYGALGEVANSVLLMTYEWGFTYGPPMAVAPIDKVTEVLNYAVTEIDPSIIFMGIPNYGYDWTLPFERGKSKAQSLSNVAAVDLARQVGAIIEFDEVSQAPFFEYTDPEGKEHIVWFEDARSIEAKVNLAHEFAFQGISYWTIMKYFPQNWLVVNSLFDINRVL